LERGVRARDRRRRRAGLPGSNDRLINVEFDSVTIRHERIRLDHHIRDRARDISRPQSYKSKEASA
jgi:hypothetical protein